MAKTTPRIRCLVCEKLVLRRFNPDDPEKPYAVVPLQIQGKRGCVCADCVEFYSEQEPYGAYIGEDPEDTDTSEEDVSTEDDSTRPPPATNTTEAGDDTTNKAVGEGSSDDNITPSEPTPEEKAKADANEKARIEAERITEIRKKYRCLDYSLDSFAKLVNRTVFGQKESVKKVVYALYMNQMLNWLEETGVSFDALNSGGSPGFKRRHILLIGDTGVGKTLLATTAPRVMGITHSISNATPITASGYVGEDLIGIVERLYNAAGGDIEKAQNGIIILDEIDKKRHEPSTSGKDVNGKAVQQELLKLLEPSTVWINKHTTPFQTGNLTIIMMGAFVGLDEIVKRRTNKKKIGFSSGQDEEEIDTNILPEDLIEYGFIPEFVGRVPCICHLNKLTVDVATDIIYSLLEKYNILFQVKGFEFFFDPFLIQKIAEKVVNSSMGARNVETCIDEILQPVLWNVFQSIPGGKCEVLEDGSAEITRTSKLRPSKTEVIRTPAIHGYEISDEDIELTEF